MANGIPLDNGGRPEDARPDDDDIREFVWFYMPFQERRNNIYAASESHDEEQEDKDDDDSEQQEQTLQNVSAVSEDEKDSNALVAAGSDLTFVFDNIDHIDDPIETPSIQNQAAKKKYSATVTIPMQKKELHKATMVAALNSDPHLSHDRLARVRQHQQYSSITSDMKDGESNDSVMIFDDYAVFDKGRKCFTIGQVIRMVCGAKEYRKPVPYKSPDINSITVSMVLYKCIGSDSQSNPLYLKGTTTTSFEFKAILSHVNLTVNSENKMVFPKEEADLLTETVRKMCKPKTNKRNNVRKTQDQPDDGRRTIQVQPDTSQAGQCRRSQRTKTQILHEFS